jgi:hypothetical protein
VGVDLAHHLASFGRSRWPCRLGSTVHLVVIINEMTARVGRDDDSVVGDMKEPIFRFDRYCFAGEMATE